MNKRQDRRIEYGYYNAGKIKRDNHRELPTCASNVAATSGVGDKLNGDIPEDAVV